MTLLIDAGYDDSTIMLCTEHRNIMSLRNYHSLREKIGLNQVSRMFGGSRGHNEELKEVKPGRGVLSARDYESSDGMYSKMSRI